jgi:hypothetical protein
LKGEVGMLCIANQENTEKIEKIIEKWKKKLKREV